MSRFLHRPMFRRGGSTGEGITSGLAPRQRYADGSGVPEVSHRGMPTFNNSKSRSSSLGDYFSKPPELPRSTAGADFWLNLGTNILAQPGGKPILQTLGTAGKEPLARFQQQRGQEKLLEYKHAQGERQFQLEWYKALNEDERIDIEKKARLAFENGDYDSYEEALSEFIKAAVYSKSGYNRPEVQERLAEEAKQAAILKNATATREFLRGEEGESISIEQAIVINEFYAQAHAQDPVWKYDTTPFLDLASIEEEWRAAKKTQTDWLSPEGNIAISPNEQSNYKEGFYYVNHFNGDVYKVGPGSTELIKIVIDEEPIN